MSWNTSLVLATKDERQDIQTIKGETAYQQISFLQKPLTWALLLKHNTCSLDWRNLCVP